MSPLSPSSEASAGLSVMTWNIRRRLPLTLRRADRWEVRASFVRALFARTRPTVVGVQEALPGTAAVVHDALGVKRYRRLGRGRGAGGRGEGAPLFVDVERVEVEAWEQLALSDRPREAGSRSWGNVVPRTLVRATLRDRATGGRFVVINTHLDPLSARSRVRSARAVRELAASGALPTIVLGDLNAGPSSPTLRELLAGGVLVDAWVAAKTRTSPEWGTFANYAPPGRGRSRIDWIAVTPDIEVVEVGVDETPYGGGWGSDHLPVHARLRLPGAAP